MYEFEIMLTSYTIVITATTLVTTRFFTKKQFKKINNDLSELKNESQKISIEIKKIYGILNQK